MASIWRIGLFERDKLNSKAICRVCRDQGENEKRYNVHLPSSSTTAAINHLNKYHKESQMLKDYERLELAKKDDIGPKKSNPIESFVVRISGGLTSLDKKIINYVACTATSFRSLNHPTMRALLNTSNEHLKDESHYRKKVLPLAYELLRVKFLEEMSKVEWISLSSDIWSTTNASFISLTAHFISKDWNRCNRVLCISQFPGSHTAENINVKVQTLIDSWKIPREKVHIILRDGGANFVKALRDGLFDSINCAAHILNLTIRDSLKDATVTKVLKKSSKIVGHFKHSGPARDAFKEIQIEQDLPCHMLLQDMIVRWNAAYKMLSRLLEQRVAVFNYCYQKELVNLNLTDHEWTIVEDLVKLLDPLEELSLLYCSDLSSSQYPFARLAFQQLERLVVQTEAGKKVKQELCNGLTERFDKTLRNKAILIAMFLDPRFKDSMHPDPTCYLQEMKEYLKEVFGAEIVADLSLDINENPIETPHPKKRLLDLFEESMTNPVIVNKAPILDEISSYLNSPRTPLKSDPIVFWKEHETIMPKLASLARRYLSAHATTLASESVFSTARTIYSYDRMRIKPRKGEMLIFLNRALSVVNYSY